MRLKPFLAALVLGVAAPGRGAFEDPARAVTQAIDKWDAPTLALVSQWASGLSKNNPKDAGLAYWRAVAAFHTVLMGADEDGNLRDAVDAARAALRLNPDARDVHGMLCVLYGMRIKNGSLRAVWLGPRLMRHGKHALREPEDPRALYLVATCRYHGGKEYEEALRLLNRADELFRAEKPAPGAPRWGRAEAMLYRAYTLEKLGRNAEAREIFKELLVLRPGHGVATERLK
jgi:tetratricopeptide (TPR) repeat protein